MVTFQIYFTYASHINEVKKHINILAVFMQLAPDLMSFEDVSLLIGWEFAAVVLAEYVWFSLLVVNVTSLQKNKKRLSHYLTVDLLSWVHNFRNKIM